MPQTYDITQRAGKRARLTRDGRKGVCGRCWDTDVECDYAFGEIQPQWLAVGELWDYVCRECSLHGVSKPKFYGAERVFFFDHGWVEDEVRPNHFKLSNHAYDNLRHGHAARYRRSPLQQRGGQVRPRLVCTPRAYPAWAECPKCGDERMLTRAALNVITLVEAASR